MLRNIVMFQFEVHYKCTLNTIKHISFLFFLNKRKHTRKRCFFAALYKIPDMFVHISRSASPFCTFPSISSFMRLNFKYSGNGIILQSAIATKKDKIQFIY